MIRACTPSFLVLILTFCLVENTDAQMDYNLSLLSRPIDNCMAGFNDVWGLEHSNGTDYAIVGTKCGISIFDLSDPTSPILLADVPGAPSVWRDMKNWGDKIFVVADQGQMGVQVIDMSDTSAIKSWQYNPILGSDTLWKAHNLFIDNSGLMYIVGSQLNGGGVVIFNLNLSDSLPPIVGQGPELYAHDVFVNESRNIILTSDIYEGKLTIHTFDWMDSLNISVNTEASQETGASFTHNAWTTEDGNIVFTTDEVPGAYVEAYDISNLEDIIFLDRYAPFSTFGSNVTPHNVHVKGKHLIISFYRDGVKIVDITRPENLVEVGGYDTEPGTGAGCWGAFPFFQSELILATDISTGCFVLQPNYTAQACHLEGFVLDGRGEPIDSAYVQVLTHDSIFEYSQNSGQYATGIVDQTTIPPDPGRSTSNTVRVLVSKDGFETKDTMITFVPGMVINQDFVLQPASLPVELISFSVENVECENHLFWSVGSVVNHSHFELQSSEDGIAFITEESVFALPGPNGWYQYIDQFTEEKNYYRLKQVDIDGSIAYSKVLFIENSCMTRDGFSIFPNPVQSYLDLGVNSEVHSIKLMDLSGKTRMHLRSLNTQRLDLSNLPCGIYYLQLEVNDQYYVEKIIKQ